MKIYLSGPITNEPNYRRNFKVAQNILESMGFTDIVNPAELCQVFDTEQTDYEQIMAICMELLNECGTVLFLPGWKNSHGCGREYGFAYSNGMRIMEFEDFVKNGGPQNDD